jgi:hypothetical protein
MVRRPKSRRRKRRFGNDAFLNVPYDALYEELYVAFIAGICAFGLTPRATLEIPGGERRLDRILQLIRRCRMSFHDLSRVELDATPPATPRFNMPFELGIAIALIGARGRKHIYLFESVKRRLNKSLSDMDGTDVYIHHGTPQVLLRVLADALVRETRQPTMAQLENVHAALVRRIPRLKGELRSDSLFTARAFRELVTLATRAAENIVAAKLIPSSRK